MTTAAKLKAFTALAAMRGYDVRGDRKRFAVLKTALAWTAYFFHGTEPAELRKQAR